MGGERSCLPVAMLNREYQKYFDLHGGDVCSVWLSLKQHKTYFFDLRLFIIEINMKPLLAAT